MDYETVIDITGIPEKTINDVKKELEESGCDCQGCTCKND